MYVFSRTPSRLYRRMQWRQAVYYDQKTGEALAAPKSRLLNTEKAGDTNSFIPELVILLLAGGPAISGFFSLKFIGVYN